MPKLQMIKRANGSKVYSVNIPLEYIEEMGWEKGDELSVSKERVGTLEPTYFKLIINNDERRTPK